MIKVEKLHKSYWIGRNELKVLKGLDMDINDGELVSIMGSSGSGKSTLLNIIGLLDNYDSGKYYLNGSLMMGLSEKQSAQYRNKFLGFVFQSFNLIPFKTALENVALPLYYSNVSRKKRQKIAAEYLEKVGLANWARHLPTELSGGEKQRVAIARSLVTDPKVILADEPTGALDTETSYSVIDVLKDINQTGKTVIIVTHEHDIAEMTNRMIHLKDGIIVEDKQIVHSTLTHE
jgi:putative ABC transport system ATP-binding protein